jgi:hypothetical protein
MDAKKNFDSVKEKIGNIFHFQFTPLKIEMFSRFQFQFRPEFILFLFVFFSDKRTTRMGPERRAAPRARELED